MTVLTNGSQVREALGDLTSFRKKQLMCIRPVAEEHQIEKWGETQTGTPGAHYEMFKPDSEDDYYFIEIGLFEKTYAETEPGSGLFQKTALTTAVQVPEGETLYVGSLEGDDGEKQTAVFPNWIAVGVDDEVWVIDNNVIERDFDHVEACAT